MNLIPRLIARSLARVRVTRPREVIFSDSSITRTRPLPEHLANSLKKARKEAGLSQQQLASMTSMTQAMISHLERGKRSPGREALRRLAVALHLDEKLQQQIIEASRPDRPLSEQLAQLAAFPLRQLERTVLKRQATLDRSKGVRVQKGGWPKRRERRGLRLPRRDRRKP